MDRDGYGGMAWNGRLDEPGKLGTRNRKRFDLKHLRFNMKLGRGPSSCRARV